MYLFSNTITQYFQDLVGFLANSKLTLYFSIISLVIGCSLLVVSLSKNLSWSTHQRGPLPKIWRFAPWFASLIIVSHTIQLAMYYYGWLG